MQRTTSIAVMLVALIPATAFAAARARLRPGTELAVGAPAELSITIDGDVDQPPAPRVVGASIRLTGQMAQTQVINGKTTQQTTYVYTLVPSHTGPLDIPAISVTTPAGVSTTEPVHATVTDAPATPARAAAPTPSAEHAAGPDAVHAFLTLDVPAKSLVVGQAVAIKIRAYFRGGTSATLEGLPRLTSDAFTLSDLSDKPAQAQVEIRGEPYVQATWTATLSPAKPSAGKLGVELPVELAFRAAPRRDPHRSLPDAIGDDPFDALFSGADPFAGGGDPFGDLDSMFDIGAMQRFQTTLSATAAPLAVTELPLAGKPPGFTGAVGHFEVALDPIAGEPRVGEPLTLSTHVTGTGNFDRVSMAGFPETAGLKTYPIKSAFTPAAESALSGAKTFTQTIVPTRAGDLTIPALALPYFDPDKHAYVTAETNPLTIAVAVARGGGAADPGLAASVHDPAMIPDRIDPGGSHATLQPQFRQPRFWMFPASLVALTALLVVAAWSRKSPRIAHVLRARRIDRAVARASAEMQCAARNHDRTAFFTAARTALQTRLAANWNTAPEAISAHDVATRLGERGASIRSVFEQADGVAYGGATATPEPFDHWQNVVRAELANLEIAS